MVVIIVIIVLIQVVLICHHGHWGWWLVVVVTPSTQVVGLLSVVSVVASFDTGGCGCVIEADGGVIIRQEHG